MKKSIRAIIIGQDKTVKLKKVKIEENRLKIGKNWEPSFSPDDILLWHRPVLGPQPTVVVVEGRMKAENLTKTKGTKVPLTLEEIGEFVKRCVAKARTKVRPITMGQFVILTLLLIVLVVMDLVIMKRIGVF
ncbi:MAG: hypothetical protein ACTSVS_01005 [Candidatus Heimdallarchaeota archaeon]